MNLLTLTLLQFARYLLNLFLLTLLLRLLTRLEWVYERLLLSSLLRCSVELLK